MNKVYLLQRIIRITNRLRNAGEEELEAEELAEALDVSLEHVMDTLQRARAFCSLDEGFDEEDEARLLDILPDQEQERPDANAEWASDQALLEKVLSRLDVREQEILRLYFGLGGADGITLEQIGQRMGLTRERVRQIKTQALDTLRPLLSRL
jgi:RNA polymerase primary sigma factor